MVNQIPVSVVVAGFDAFMEETFEQVKGIYLDRETSLFETLEMISAEQASQPVSNNCASIAAHVEHIRFYMEVLEDELMKRDAGDIDWSHIWRTVKTVSPRKWERSKTKLKEAYERIRSHMKNHEQWGERELSCVMPMIVHTAHHLGEIRQAMCHLREQPGDTIPPAD